MVDGIQFKSGLEAFTYKAIIQIGLFPQYEVQKFKLFQGFPYKGVQAYLPSKKTKHQKTTSLQLKTSKVLDITYTPDFIVDLKEFLFIIEVKGRANDRYPYVRKLFFKYLEELSLTTKKQIFFFEPHNQSHVNDMITIITTKLKTSLINETI